MSVPAGDIETYHDRKHSKWINKIEGRADELGEYPSKAEAVQEGRKFALFISKYAELSRRRTVEHIVRNEDGTIGSRNTYPRSEDPPETPG